MRYSDLIFDLYGTLIDIHTEEDDAVWEKTALYFGYYGAHYTGNELRTAFQSAMAQKKAKAGQSYECFPDLPFEPVMAQLFRDRGVTDRADELGKNAAQLFRICSTEYIRLYPGVTDALKKLRQDGYRLWLLSNAQRIFTAFELNHLGLAPYFDGIYLSSDFACRKPDIRFFSALVEEQKLNRETCLMIGNDLDTDIAGAKNAGLDTLYMHTGLTPPDQRPADPGNSHEYEGWDWEELVKVIESL